MGGCHFGIYPFSKPMRNSEFYPAHIAGEMVSGYFGNFHKKNCHSVKLVQFIDFVRDNRNNVVRRLPDTTHPYAFIKERWLCEHNNEVVECLLQHFYEENEQTLVIKDRPMGQYPDNELEVNLLTDSYEEFIENNRDLHLKDPLLMKVQDRANARLLKLKTMFQSEQDAIKKDILFNIILHKETPCSITHKRIKKLKEQYPLIFSQISNKL